MPEFKSTIRVDAKGTEKTKQKLGGIEGSLKKLGKSAALAAAGFFGARMLIQGLTKATQAAVRQEKAIQTLEQVMKSMGRFTPQASRQLQEYAKQLSRVTTFSDEAVLEGIGFLQTYKQIADDVMPKAINVMADIASLMGGDMQIAANKVGKAAMGMTGELREVGITIDEDVAASGDFVAILNEIENQVGGVAKATGEGLGGSLARMTNAVTDAAQAFGEMLAPAILSASSVITKFAAISEKVFQVMRVGREIVQTSKDKLNEWVTSWVEVKLGIEQATEAQIEFQNVSAFGEMIAQLEAEKAARLSVIEARQKAIDQGIESGGVFKKFAANFGMMADALDNIATEGAIELYNEQIEKLKEQALEAGFSQVEFNRILKGTKDGLEETTEAYVAQTDAIYGWATANQTEQQGRESVQGTFAEWMFAQQEAQDARDRELEYIEILKQDYPDLAKALGHVGKQTETNKNMSSKWAGVVSDVSSMNKSASKENALVAKRAAQLEAIVNTSKEVTKVLANPPMAAYVAAMGAIQIATIEAASFAKGGDFITQGPQMMVVGDNPGGRERVQVTPLSSPNVSGPTNSFSINVSAPLVDETVVDSIIPAIQKAQRLGTA
jgi:hypothetical protein